MHIDEITAATTVASIASGVPAALDVFEDLGIEFACRGNRTLAQACETAGLEVEEVLTELRRRAETGWVDWSARPLAELIEHMTNDHHALESPEMKKLHHFLLQVRDTHGGKDPALVRVVRVFEHFMQELNSHTFREERDLFPQIEALERDAAKGEHRAMHRIANQVLVQYLEHDALHDRMRVIRELTSNYTVPHGACEEVREVMIALRAFERGLQRHMHLENNVLFPRAAVLETQLKERAGALAAV